MVGTSFIGRELGRYRILSVVGSGGFATVYRALDTALERQVALNVVDPAAHHNPDIARRFLREGQAVASLDHPAVVPVYDAGDSDGVLWLAMRLIEGGSLDDALRSGRRLSTDDVVAVVARIGGALDHAHAQGVVHRDVKPSNILLEDNDPRRAWLADFGIAATARTMGQYTTGALGTAAYMAPEQSRPGSAGPPADRYSLACVAFEMVTGRRPYPGDDYVALLMAHATSPVPRSGHPGLDALMERAMAKDPARRPVSGAALTQELRRALTQGAGTTAMLPPTQPVPSPAASPSPSPPAPVSPSAPVSPASRASPAPGSRPAGGQRHVPPPTVVEPRDHTLVHPQAHHAPAAPAAPPYGGWSSSGSQPAAPVPPRPRRRRSGGGRRMAVGTGALVVAAVTTFLALPGRETGTVQVTDAQGIEYVVPRSWDRVQESPATVYAVGSDDVIVTVENFESDGSTAPQLLPNAGVDGPLCQGDVGPASVDGATSAARCSNPEGDIAEVVGASRNTQFWVITVHRSVPADQRDAFLESLHLVDPGSS